MSYAPARNWRAAAVCSSVDPELFYEPSGRETGPELAMRLKSAKKVCGGCPVARDCLIAALEENDRHGIRGGLTPDERQKRRTVRRLAAAIAKAA